VEKKEEKHKPLWFENVGREKKEEKHKPGLKMCREKRMWREKKKKKKHKPL